MSSGTSGGADSVSETAGISAPGQVGYGVSRGEGSPGHLSSGRLPTSLLYYESFAVLAKSVRRG